MVDRHEYKRASFFCTMLAVVTCPIFMVKYWQLYIVALDYNEAAVDGASYDQCGLVDRREVDIQGELLPAFESGWTQVFKFQAILYTVLVFGACLSLLGLFYPHALLASVTCVSVAMCLLAAAIIMTGVRRLNADGQLCADSTAVSEPGTGATFKDNAKTLRALFIAQCVLYFPTCGYFIIGYFFAMLD